jgi:hypothetical protein
MNDKKKKYYGSYYATLYDNFSLKLVIKTYDVKKSIEKLNQAKKFFVPPLTTMPFEQRDQGKKCHVYSLTKKNKVKPSKISEGLNKKPV